MTIDFDKITEAVVPHFKGGDGETCHRMFLDGANKIMRGRLEPGCSIGYHLHDTSCEAIFILGGEACCLYDGGEERLVAGQCTYCPKGHSHSLINASTSEPLTYFAVVAEQ